MALGEARMIAGFAGEKAPFAILETPV